MFIKKDIHNNISSVKCDILVLDENKFFNTIKYYTEEFMSSEYTKATDFLEYAKYFAYEISNMVLISHSEGIALTKGFIGVNQSLSPVPLIHVYSDDIKKGFRFYHGNGRVKILRDNGYYIFDCKGLGEEEEVFLLWLIYQIENKAAISCPNVSYTDEDAEKIAMPEDILSKFFDLKDSIVNNNPNFSYSNALSFYENNLKLSQGNILLKACLNFHLSDKQAFKMFGDFFIS